MAILIGIIGPFGAGKMLPRAEKFYKHKDSPPLQLPQ